MKEEKIEDRKTIEITKEVKVVLDENILLAEKDSLENDIIISKELLKEVEEKLKLFK